MADTTFIITPSGDEYSMVSDGFFNSLESNQYSQSTTPDVALDWLLNVKKFCVVEETSGECMRGIYEAIYGIGDYTSYATPVTDLGDSYKEPQIGGSYSSTLTGAAGEVMQTSPRNPHRYTLQSDPNNTGSPPPELTGEYLGAFFHHKGSWYASFDDLSNVGSGSASSKEITINTKKAKAGSASKKIYVMDKFFPTGETIGITQCGCAACFFVGGFGDGNSFTFDLNSSGVPTTLQIKLFASFYADSITVTAGGGSYFSGCNTGLSTGILYLPNGAESITVEVNGNCDGSEPELEGWYFEIECVGDEPP